ncbi:MAG: aminotransferase class V-fold PLP-dependent enzyme, partial [Gammaproteobacteria bacterium]|nr:aminotransferase class V-fold PLP-dependent enzyme [Gammaproteobacteria bacterium]
MNSLNGAIAEPAVRDGSPLDLLRIRQDFPILHQQINGKPLAYLDNGATVQKPAVVIEAVARFYREDNANVHRGVHTLSERATAAYNRARATVRRFIHAPHRDNIVFVRGTTEAINLVAQTFVRDRLHEGDEILITELEHHSNIVPWQILCRQTGAKLIVAPINDAGEVPFEGFVERLSPRTRMVSVAHVSNALGTINPVKRMIEAAHAQGAPVLVDGAQAAPHMAIDVQDLDCDFYAFSSHKVYGPTGIGALYGMAEHLEEMPPYQSGGDMIKSVSFKGSVYAPPPYKFEAGTQNIAGAVGMGVALDYVSGIGLDAIAAHEHELLTYATRKFSSMEGIRIVGTARDKASLLS